jgi:hypothetical protein
LERVQGDKKQGYREDQEFVEEAISQAENKPKDMWDKLKKFLPSKKTNTNCTILRDNNAVFKETRYIAECFNNSYCSIGHELKTHFDDTLPTVQNQMPKNSYTIPSITADFVQFHGTLFWFYRLFHSFYTFCLDFKLFGPEHH